MFTELLLFLLGSIGLLAWLMQAWPICRALRHARTLDPVQPADPPTSGESPTVSVIVPACNEEAAIERCLLSLCRQTYPDVEIIAIDDRSSDGTGAEIDRLAASQPRLRAVHVRELPDGWLGKNHANHAGAALATGEWLLFTDGDVFFHPDCLRRAVAFAQAERLDHLCLFPDLICHGYWERVACCLFGVLFTAFCKPWHARNPSRRDAFCGVGAFNLVRRTAYDAIGTHQRLRLEVGDDVKLAKLIKHAGLVSDVILGRPYVAVRWQQGLRGIVRGLEKNGFAGVDYRIGRALLGVSAMLGLAILPPLGTLLAPGWARLPFAAGWVSQMLTLGLAARGAGMSPLIGLGFPVAALALGYAALRSMVLALVRGGISWRGTFYPLRELRSGSV